MLFISKTVAGYIVLLISLLLLLIQPVTAQYDAMTITPKKIKGWTGSVRSIDGKYDKLDGEIKTGKGSFYSFFRGYAMFDVTNILDDAIIDKIELKLTAEPDYESEYHPVEIFYLPVNPIEEEARVIFETMNHSESVASQGNYLNKTSRVVELNETANLTLKASLAKNWWAIGFIQTDDGKGPVRSVGGFSGYNSTDSIIPLCKVSYSFEYKRKSFEGRNVSYVKVLNVKNAEIRFAVWDHMKVDGDIITLFLNEKPVISEYYITKEKKIATATLRTDMPNELLLFAHNEGLHTHNTV